MEIVRKLSSSFMSLASDGTPDESVRKGDGHQDKKQVEDQHHDSVGNMVPHLIQSYHFCCQFYPLYFDKVFKPFKVSRSYKC